MKAKNKNKKRNQTLSNISKLKILLALILITVPLIVHSKVVQIIDPSYQKWLNSSYSVDFFSHYKLALLVPLSLFAILIAIFEYKGSIVKKGKVLSGINATIILLSIMAIFTILSSVFSKYSSLVLWGTHDRHEGALTLLAYFSLCFSAYVVSRKEADINWITKSLMLTTTAMSIIGLTQFVGHDFFTTQIGQMLIMDSELIQRGVETKITIEKTMVYGTVFHSNYLGSYAAVCFAYFTSLMLQAKERKIGLMSLIFALISFCLIFGSRSRAGILALCVSAIVLLIVHRKVVFKSTKVALALLALIITVSIGMNSLTHGVILNKLSSLTVDPRLKYNTVEHIEDIKIANDILEVKTNQNILKMRNLGNLKVAFQNDAGRALSWKSNKTTAKNIFADSKYKNISFMVGNLNEMKVIKIHINDIEILFSIDGTHIKLLDPYNKPIEVKKPQSYGFKGNEQFASARGYIWSRTLPLILTNGLLGSGPDTFAHVFPQEDYLGKLKAYGTMSMIVDKPHNMYLQMLVQTGVVVLIAFLGIIVSYYSKLSSNLMSKNMHGHAYESAMCIVPAVTAYLVAGLFNDSVISVAPIFWILLGTGLGLSGQMSEDKIVKNEF